MPDDQVQVIYGDADGAKALNHRVHYILLMRHARHTPESLVQGDTKHLEDIAASLRKLAQGSVLTQQGEEETRSVAKTVIRHIAETGEDIKFAGGIAANSPEAQETAKLSLESLGFKEPKPRFRDGLGPDIPPGSKNDVAKNVIETVHSESCELCVRKERNNEVVGNAVLVVGHQPMLGWISEALAGEAYSLANSELLCLELTRPFNRNDGQPCAWLRWVVSPSDDKAIEDLRDKIRSKMEIAKLLSGFIAAGLGFVTSNLADAAKVKYLGRFVAVAEVGAVLLFLALLLYLTTMCSYDALLMPKRFWSESAAGSDNRPRWIVARPPSSAFWILYQNMLHVWTWQFMPATYFLVTGFLFMGTAVFARNTSHFRISLPVALLVPLTLAVVIIYPYLLRTTYALKVGWSSFRKCPLGSKFRFVFGPWLGSED